ncbi:MAG: hypothetical protein ACRD82_24185 [Blastocatellia bacterium]
MSTITAENVLKLIEQLPELERSRLSEMLAQPPEPATPVKTKRPLDKRVPCRPMADRTREHQWVREHKHEYPGHWVVLDGDQLIAASLSQQEVLDAMNVDGEIPQLLLRIPSPDDLPYIGI